MLSCVCGRIDMLFNNVTADCNKTLFLHHHLWRLPYTICVLKYFELFVWPAVDLEMINSVCVFVPQYSGLSNVIFQGAFETIYGLLNSSAREISTLYKNVSFSVLVWYFKWNFVGNHWNSTQTAYPYIEGCICLYTYENMRVITFKSLYASFKVLRCYAINFGTILYCVHFLL